MNLTCQVIGEALSFWVSAIRIASPWVTNVTMYLIHWCNPCLHQSRILPPKQLFLFSTSVRGQDHCRRVPAWENHFRMPGTNHSRISWFSTLKLAWHVPICNLLRPRVIKHSPSLDLTQESFETSAHKVQQFRQHRFPNHTASINKRLFDEPNCVSMHRLFRASSWYYILVSCGATQSVQVIYIYQKRKPS